MLCNEIMKKTVECVRPDDDVRAAAKKMKNTNIGFIPVCEDGKRVIGTITDRDIAMRIVADGKPLETRARDVMTRDLITCRPGDDLKEAEELMSKHKKSRILCVDDQGKLEGVISLSDIAQHEGRERAAQTFRAVTEREARP